jgi:hypothetical protein
VRFRAPFNRPKHCDEYRTKTKYQTKAKDNLRRNKASSSVYTKVFFDNLPIPFLMMKHTTSLGSLVALYEHKILFAGNLFGAYLCFMINGEQEAGKTI